MKIRKPLKPLQFLSPAPGAKGSILILALWAICFLSGLAVLLGVEVRQKLNLIKRFDQRDRLHLAAEAGLNRAIMELMKEEPKSYSSLGDPWSDNPILFKDSVVGEGMFSVSYTYSDGQDGALKTGYGLIDEERKININKMENVVLERLFKLLGLSEMEAQELAASIKDWRDPDSELSLPLGSAEDMDYHSLKYSYDAKDADFESLDELNLVKGMNKDVFAKIKDYVTIYGDGKININTASKIVLLSLGLGEDLTEKIILFRYGDKKQPPDVFVSASEIVPKLSQSFHLSGSDIALLSAIVERYLSVHSDNFFINSVASLPNHLSPYPASAVVNRSGKILYWREP